MLNLNPMTETSITIPLSQDAHDFARTRAAAQSSLSEASSTYLNSLALYAVEFYLQLIETPTASVPQAFEPTLALSLPSCFEVSVPGFGAIDCRAVRPTENALHVPPECWEPCRTHVAVRVNEALTEATLLGYRDRIQQTATPLGHLRPIEHLLDRLPDYTATAPTSLTNWLQGAIERHWQPLAALLAPTPERAWRSPNTSGEAEGRAENPSNHFDADAEGGKWIDFPDGTRVALVVDVRHVGEPTSDGDLDVRLRLYPAPDCQALPKTLRLMVLDEVHVPVIETQACGTDRLDVEFGVEAGEAFAVKLVLNDIEAIEYFAG